MKTRTRNNGQTTTQHMQHKTKQTTIKQHAQRATNNEQPTKTPLHTKHQTTHNEQQPTSNEPLATNNTQHASINKPQTTHDAQQTTNNEQRTTNH